jgi:prophage regulatory protein
MRPSILSTIAGHNMKTTTLVTKAYLRLPQVLEIFPISKSSWWAGVASGKYPKSVKLGPRTTAWRSEDIRALLDEINSQVTNDE